MPVTGTGYDRATAKAVDAMELIHSADLSPDGRLAAWSISRIEGDTERRGLRLSAVDEPGEAPVALEFGECDHTPAFSPDGSRLAFLSSDGPATRIVLAGLSGAPHVDFEVLVDPDEPNRSVSGKPAWSPDGRRLAYAATHRTRVAGAPYRITRVIGWADGLGLVDDATADIFVYDLDAGTHTRLTDDEWVNSQPAWLLPADSPEPDGAGLARIAFRAGFGPEEWQQSIAAVRSVSADGSDATVTEHIRAPDLFSLAALSDGRIAVTSLGAKPRSLGRLFTVDPASGATTESVPGHMVDRTTGLNLDVNGDVLGDIAIPFMDPDARLLVHEGDALLRVHVEDRLEVHRIALDGEPRATTLLSGPGCFYPLAVAGRRLLHATGTLTSPPDLWVRDMDTGEDIRLTDTATRNRARAVPSMATTFRVPTENGVSVQAKLLRPANAVGALPTVLLIHGGPKAAYGEAYVTDAHLLCGAGFGVLMVNPRGSRGYGMDFADAIIGDWGNDDFRDLTAAVDFAVEEGWADPDRLGVAGLSYGGYMSSWIVGHTDRFRAAVIENPATNFSSMYGTSDVGLSFLPAVLDALPQTDSDRYRELSPITMAHTCTTPTLLIQGEADHRCPPEQSKQFYSVLRRAGCVAEMLMLPDASHEGTISGPVPSRRAQNEALVDWMVRHVKNAGPVGPDTGEKASLSPHV
ncbi:S9 family peptidase [Streptomyces sp. 110]|uniref:S9 family peptidase n=1 Tax=Streptomyces endocoffeicus TaxID=2898945 RepID=A0ABS1PEU4_9ACTN|nr:S9 family peptidase [Streptomyces endocoffeicus]MBL1110892.1 S9 family peptidase [Streptomyces endocoffeicus]